MDALDIILEKVRTQPERVEFNEVIEIIDSLYDFTPTEFANGELQNHAGENNGSCKLFAFGLMHQLEPLQLLHCFGSYYRDDVLKHPNGNSHQNIRNFIKSGWDGIKFYGEALAAKEEE